VSVDTNVIGGTFALILVATGRFLTHFMKDSVQY
jgi:hypothetical protein